jgi:hypothetical protein
MKSLIIIVAALGLAVPAVAAPGQASQCPTLAWSETKTAAPTPEDIAMLQCWHRSGDPGAGFILAMLTKAGKGVAASPLDARLMLLALAKGQDGGSITGGLSSRVRSFNMDQTGRTAEDVMVKPYPPAMRELAKMQLLGQGGDKDVPAAMGWLEKAKESDKEAGILYTALKAKGY